MGSGGRRIAADTTESRSPKPVASTIKDARLLLATGLAVLGFLVVASSADAVYTCRESPAESEHCYAIDVFHEPNIINGARFYTFIGEADVPEYNSQFADDELWARWNAAGGSCPATWIEVGAIVGELKGGSPGPSTPYAFTASCTVAAGFLSYAYTTMTVPVASWFELSGDAALLGGGWDWYVYFNGVGPWGADSYLPTRDPTTGIEDGDENTSNANLLTGEINYAEWQNNGGEWFPWKYSGNFAKRTTIWNGQSDESNIPACATASARKTAGDFIFYSHTGTPYSVCYQKSAETFVRTGPIQSAVEELEAPPSSPSFASLWHAPNESTPEKTDAEVGTSVDAVEAELGSAPTSYTEVRTTRASALNALKGVVPSGSEHPEIEAWLAGGAILVQASGHFVAEHVSLPAGTSAPTGTMLSLVLDAHTGAVMAMQINSTGPSLSQYGTVVEHG